MRISPLVVALAAVVLGESVHAAPPTEEMVWSSSICTGVPLFRSDSPDVITRADVLPSFGRYLEFMPGKTGIAYVYLPVVVPNQSTLNCIRLRAVGGSLAYVEARLYRQPNCVAGGAESLGHVRTVDGPPDPVLPPERFQCVEDTLSSPVTVDYSCHSYYVRIVLWRTSTTKTVRAFDVSLHHQCPACP
jgi:hypothetical protein